MQKNSDNFSMGDIMKMAASPAGRQLLALLKQSDPNALKSAMSAATSGNMQAAGDALAPLLASEEAQKLLRQLGG